MEFLPRRAFQGDACQAVHVIVCEGFFQVGPVVFSAG
jgi:hypothetical protein